MEASAFERAMPARAARRRLPRRSDARLVAHLRAGDERAFEELYDRYGASLLAFCRHMLGSPEEGEDALQHTFMAAHGALERGEAPEHLKAWLYTIARNRCLSVLRAQREHAAFEDDAPAAVSTAGLAAEVQQRTELRELVADLGRLPEDQRAALVLFELGDHAQDEIAAVLGVRREKVKALVFQAREALIGWRTARETPCAEVREQLSTLRGSALRRAPLRRHVEVCAGCRDFEAQVRRQRAALAVALPIVPAAGLKSAVLSAALGGGAASAAATATTAATAGSGALAAVQGVAAKGLVAVAIAAGAGGTGYVAVKQIDRAPAAPAHHAPAATRRPAAAATGAAAPARHAPAATPRPAVAAAPTRRHAGRAHARARRAHPAASHPAATARRPARGRSAAPGQAPARTTAKAHGKATTHAARPKRRPAKARPVRAHPARKVVPVPATATPPSHGAARTPAVAEPVPTPAPDAVLGPAKGNAKAQP